MFMLLKLKILSFSVSAAKRNYREIISILDPNKNQSSEVKDIIKAVIQAFNTLMDVDKREYYKKFGNISATEPYDNADAARKVLILNRLMTNFRREAFEIEEEKRRLIREKSRNKRNGEREMETNTEIKTTMCTTGTMEKSFEMFLKQCKDAANINDGEIKDVKTNYNTFKQNQALQLYQQKTPTTNDNSYDKTDETLQNSQKSNGTLDIRNRSEILDARRTETETYQEILTHDSGLDTDLSQEQSRKANQNSSKLSNEEVCSQSRNRNVNSLLKGCISDITGPELHDNTESESDSRNIDKEDFVDVHIHDATGNLAKSYKDMGTSPIKWTQTREMGTSPIRYIEISGGGSIYDSVKVGKSQAERTQFNNHDRDGQINEESEPHRHETFESSIRDGNIGRDKPDFHNFNMDRQYIMEISNMRTRDGITSFKVKWGPSGQEKRENADEVIREKAGLRNWLERLNIEEPKRYGAILKFHPEFGAVFQD